MASKILVYQLWPESWGNIRAMTLFLPRVKALGADYVWVPPIFSSPWRNHGYDVTDHFLINPKFGTLADFDEFVKTAHILGLRVIIDLVIDSTSVDHIWYRTDLNRYVWDYKASLSWQNLYDHGSAWQYDESKKQYYLHLGHPSQPDLDWFRGGILNRPLADYFRNVMSFWMSEHGVDGFRLSSIQSLNKDISQEKLELDNILVGQQAVTAVNELSNIYGGKTPFLMMDCIDPNHGSVVDYYAENTDVEFITNAVLRACVPKKAHDFESFSKKLEKYVKNPKFMLSLESHDSSRFTSRTGFSGKEAINLIFGSGAHAVCLYQGQELGLKNSKNLSLAEIFRLDERAVVQLEHRASIESIRQTSRANTRLPLPLDEYAKQEVRPGSVLNHTKNMIREWRSK